MGPKCSTNQFDDSSLIVWKQFNCVGTTLFLRYTHMLCIPLHANRSHDALRKSSLDPPFPNIAFNPEP